MDTYSHVLPNLQQDAVKRLGALLLEKTGLAKEELGQDPYT